MTTQEFAPTIHRPRSPQLSPAVAPKAQPIALFSSGQDGGIVHRHSWLPTGNIVARIVLLHGFGEHLGLYGRFAQRLNDSGIAVFALDHTGHGRSEGRRVVVDDVEGLVVYA